MLRIDWRTWVAFAFAMLVVWVVADELGDRGAEHDASIERRELLAGQKDMQTKIDTQTAKYSALVDWLNDQDIEIPEFVLNPQPAGAGGRGDTSIRVESSDDDDDDGGGTTVPKAPTAPTIRPRPSATTTTPAGPLAPIEDTIADAEKTTRDLIDQAERIVPRAPSSEPEEPSDTPKPLLDGLLD